MTGDIFEVPSLITVLPVIPKYTLFEIVWHCVILHENGTGFENCFPVTCKSGVVIFLSPNNQHLVYFFLFPWFHDFFFLRLNICGLFGAELLRTVIYLGCPKSSFGSFYESI